ncbi:MAG TPA: class I SAM-dependent methyltransferase [Candidatus Eisenbergiella merdipullorum]|uniref:Class I SAM-dependent methyltransferase n=1 Tax=Candidatus Eisenbergiella merdipullorum TaxID=2838553 RepID=A0A9D2I511_9FIRM|nr:class I SAM-dependent methyltransferase [Candidatus Eisenbergiella merdipullorum]
MKRVEVKSRKTAKEPKGRWKEVANRFQRYLIFLGEYLFLERPRGLDFTMRDTGLYRLSDGKYHGYSKTDEGHLREIFESLDFSRCRRLLDVGCGKGVVLKEAAKFPFEKIAGIEIQKGLVRTAERNFRILGLEKRICCIQADAMDFEGYGEYDVFFFFNPFSEEVFESVIERILESRKKDGPLTFIYHNPRYLGKLEELLRRAVPGGMHKTMLHDKKL